MPTIGEKLGHGCRNHLFSTRADTVQRRIYMYIVILNVQAWSSFGRFGIGVRHVHTGVVSDAARIQRHQWCLDQILFAGPMSKLQMGDSA